MITFQPILLLSNLVLHPLPSTQTPHLEGEEATDRQSSILPIGLTNGSKNRPSATPPEHMVSISVILWLLDFATAMVLGLLSKSFLQCMCGDNLSMSR